MEKGIGKHNGVAQELSSDLGNEIDLSLSFTFNDNLTIGLLSGCFFPAKFYKKERDGETGSLFTPFMRGDGNVDNAWQLEAFFTIAF